MIKKITLLSIIVLFQLGNSCKAQEFKLLTRDKKTISIDKIFTPNIGGIKQVLDVKTDD